jgi:hypothetical protein
VRLGLDERFPRGISCVGIATFSVRFTVPGNIFTRFAIHQMQMHRGRSLLLSALAPTPALLVATRAAWLCSGMVVLHLCSLVGTPDETVKSFVEEVRNSLVRNAL